MKRGFNLWTLDVGRWTLPLGLLLFSSLLSAPASVRSIEDNPYGGIVERNAFAIKPPPPPSVATPPPAPPSNVELRGITTLLGRPQVLLNFKLPPKPPEPPKDRSLVMDVGQREGEVEVLEINPAAGTVRIRNQGTELAMNLKENASKPQGAPASGLVMPPPLAGAVPPANAGGIPAPAAPASAGSSSSSIGGGSSANPSGAKPVLPSRNIRSGPTPGASPPLGTSSTSGDHTLPLDAQVALIEVERERTKDAVSAGKMPPLPPMNLPK